MIQLSVGNLEIDWGKNRGFTDHSAFFQTTDVTPVPYYYGGSDYVDAKGEKSWKISVEYKEGLSKPLCEVKDRIELMGHTIAHCRQEFMHLADLNDFDVEVFEFDSLAVSKKFARLWVRHPFWRSQRPLDKRCSSASWRRSAFPTLRYSSVALTAATLGFFDGTYQWTNVLRPSRSSAVVECRAGAK
jgi:hypothetical protein